MGWQLARNWFARSALPRCVSRRLGSKFTPVSKDDRAAYCGESGYYGEIRRYPLSYIPLCFIMILTFKLPWSSLVHGVESQRRLRRDGPQELRIMVLSDAFTSFLLLLPARWGYSVWL